MRYLGTSGWAYATWKPKFYPEKLASARFLEYYGTRLNSVEVNYTFKTMPSAKLLEKWIAATPEGFQFAIKAHWKITHQKRLRDVESDTKQFLDLLSPLSDAKRLGPVLFQLPPYLKADTEMLRTFVGILPKSIRSAMEFRHASWFTDETYAVLREGNVSLCVAEDEKLETPEVRTATFVYLRLRKGIYSPKAAKQVATRVANLARGGDVYAYFKHLDDPRPPLSAEEVLKAES